MIGYGASARSSTLLNFCGINHRHLVCIADGNPIKQGKFTAGTDIPIVSPDEAFAKKPDIVLLLAWNFEDEIVKWTNLDSTPHKIKSDDFKDSSLLYKNDPQIIEL